MADIIDIDSKRSSSSQDETHSMLEICGPAYDSRYETRWPDRTPSETHLAERLLATYAQPTYTEPGPDPATVVSSVGKLWRASKGAPLWIEIDEYEVGQRVRRWDGRPCGSEKRPRHVSISEQTYVKITKVCTTRLLRADKIFFSSASPGFAVRGHFIAVDLEDGCMRSEPLTREHRQRHRLDIDVGLEAIRWAAIAELGAMELPPEIDRELYGPKDSLLRKYLASVHSGPDSRARVVAMGQIIFAALTGTGPRWHRAVMAFGPPGSGKSQYLLMAHGLMPEGSVCSIAPQRMGDDAHVVSLEGKRLNAVFESTDEVWSTSAFKSIVMGELVRARDLYEKAVEFFPVALHMFAGNKLPRIKGSDPAVWDRWLPIAFEKVFRDTSADVKDIGARIAREEAAELVRWALWCGQIMLKADGYTMPGCSQIIQQRWKTDSDPVMAWIEEMREIGGASTLADRPTLASEYSDFKDWCSVNGHRSPAKRTFASRLRDNDIWVERSSGATRVGLITKLAQDEEEDSSCPF